MRPWLREVKVRLPSGLVRYANMPNSTAFKEKRFLSGREILDHFNLWLERNPHVRVFSLVEQVRYYHDSSEYAALIATITI